MYLPARLISFDIFTAALDRDSRARTKTTPSRLHAIQTSRSVHRKWKQSAWNDNTLSNIVPLSLKQLLIFSQKNLQL